MFSSVSGINDLVATPILNLNSAPTPNLVPDNINELTSMNPTFIGQTVQPVGWTMSTASTQRWPSEEHYFNSSSSSFEVPNRPPATIALPIQNLQEMTDLEHAISSMQQYECLLGHLQVLTIRHQANVNEMFRNFITDSVLSRVGYSRPKSGKYDCTMRDHFPRIMSAIKSAWFPDRDRETFEAQLLLLLKNAHTRYKDNGAINLS